MLEAVTQIGNSPEHAAPECRDREIVLEAVNSRWADICDSDDAMEETPTGESFVALGVAVVHAAPEHNTDREIVPEELEHKANREIVPIA